jgi:hypothetical protein
MKLFCVSIEPKIWNKTNIKVGEVYTVVDDTRTWDDHYKMIYVDIGGGEKQEYPKTCFVPLEMWRDKQINRILK